jgi:hypothetical protein
MAETPRSPENPEPQAAATPEALLESVSEALDLDDLPAPHHGTTPPTPAAVARPEAASPTPPEAEPPAETAAAGAVPEEPAIAASVEIPPLEPGSGPTGAGEAGSGESEGGEWELLTGKVRDWFARGELQRFVGSIRGPLKGLAYLIALVLLLRVYASVVGTIDALPLIGGLLELVGLITAVRFCLANLVRSTDREKVIASWRQRWIDFRGRV